MNNARLMKVAPAMYEVLKAIVIEECPNCDGTGREHLFDDICGTCGGYGRVITHYYAGGIEHVLAQAEGKEV